LRINEIAWAGTIASANDEWLELYNPSGATIQLSGWLLSDGGDLQIPLNGAIAAHGYALLERTDDTSVSDISAHQIYTGNLNNSGEVLRLTDPSGSLVDSANLGGGAWPAGNASTRGSMERLGGGDQAGTWRTFTGHGGNGHDANGNPIQGTPGQPNSLVPLITPTLQATLTPSPTATLMAGSVRSVMINEVAWAGTIASASDEWIELLNPSESTISLEGWRLTDGGDLNVTLSGSIGGHGYYLLERTDDSTINSITADKIYSGGLSNNGETLRLEDAAGNLIDSANIQGGSWPAGNDSTRASMEREGGPDLGGNWETFTGYHGNGYDASGNPIKGTPRNPNSLHFPTPVPYIPGAVKINEVLIRPHYDWEGKGGVDTGDEFIELINLGPGKVFLKGWILDDISDGGSRPYKIPGITLKPGSMVAFFRSKTHIALNDGGDTVRLVSSHGILVDEIQYLKVRAYNLSYGRLPDGSGHLQYGLWPTPNEANLAFVDPFIPYTGLPALCPDPDEIRVFLVRHARHPSQIRWLRDVGFGVCG
jgi:hypothetical protein